MQSKKRSPRRRTAAARRAKQPAQSYSFESRHGKVKYAFYTGLAVSAVMGFLVFGALYAGSYISLSAATIGSSIALSLFFMFVAFSYQLARGMTLKQTVSSLGLSRGALSLRNLGLGLLLFAAVLVVEIAIGTFQAVTGISLPTNTAAVFAGMPAYFLAFAVMVAPFDEEVLFRGFLVPRIGIIASALLFALLHLLSYLSVSEFIAALAFGLMAGYAYRRTGSLYVSITAHMLVNLLGLLALAAA